MKNTSKLLTVLITFAMLASSICITSFADEAADGSYGVNTTYLALKPGETGYITVSADNAAGRVDWSASGSVYVDGATSAWLDNGTATIPVTASSEGTGYITVSPTSIASYGGTELSSSYTIQVDVIGDNSSADNSQTPVDNNQGAADNSQTVDNSQNTANNNNIANATPVAQVAAEDTGDQAAADTAQEEETTTAADVANTTVLTDASTDYAELSEEDRLYTTVNETELYMIRYPRMLDEEGNVIWNEEIAGLELLEGFELTRVNYKGLDVDAFTHGDTTVFVLKNLETDESDYYVLNNGVGFSKLTYVTANNKVYIVIDFPADFQVPDGYQMVELSLGDNKIHALKKLNTEAAVTEETTQPAETEAAAEETTQPAETEAAAETEANEASAVVDSRTEVMLKGYEELISPGLDSADPSGDIYYIYCLVDGNTQLYSYDSSEGTLQRASITVYDEIPTEPETVIVYENESENQNKLLAGIGWYNMAIQVKMLLIALAVAIIIIVILIILYIVANCRNKKLSQMAGRGSHHHRGGPAASARRGNVRRNAENGDESIFSYVKTEPDDINMDDFDNL